MSDHTPAGEVHNSWTPLLISFGFTITLAALLAPILAVIGVPLLVYSIYYWIKEDVGMWKDRNVINEKMGDASWAMVWIIVTEVIVFGGFFAFWFWAKWHTVNWDGAIADSTWPAEGVHHNMAFVGLMTFLLVASDLFAHKSLKERDAGNYSSAVKKLWLAVVLGVMFLVIQAYEYYVAGFTWASHPYGTAFFSITGLHGLHVLAGAVALGIVAFLAGKGLYDQRRDSFQAVVWYWRFVGVIWLLLVAVVYIEVI